MQKINENMININENNLVIDFCFMVIFLFFVEIRSFFIFIQNAYNLVIYNIILMHKGCSCLFLTIENPVSIMNLTF